MYLELGCQCFTHKRNWPLKWVILCELYETFLTFHHSSVHMLRMRRTKHDKRFLLCLVFQSFILMLDRSTVEPWRNTQRRENSGVFGSSATQTDLYLQESIKWKARVTLGDRQKLTLLDIDQTLICAAFKDQIQLCEGWGWVGVCGYKRGAHT